MGLGLGLCCCEDRVVCNTDPKFYFTAIDRGLGPGFHYFVLRISGGPSFLFPNKEFLLSSVNNSFVFERPQIAIDEAGDDIEVELILGETQTRFDEVTCIPPFSSCLTFHIPVSLIITDPINGTTRFNFVENVSQSDSCLGVYGHWSSSSENCPNRISLLDNVSSRLFRENNPPTFQVRQQGVTGGGTCNARNDTFTLSNRVVLLPSITDGWATFDSWDLTPINVNSALPNMAGIHLEITSFPLKVFGATFRCFPDSLSTTTGQSLGTYTSAARLTITPIDARDDFFVVLDLGFPNGIQNKINYLDTDWSDMAVSFTFGDPFDCNFDNASWTLIEV